MTTLPSAVTQYITFFNPTSAVLFSLRARNSVLVFAVSYNRKKFTCVHEDPLMIPHDSED